MHGVRTKSLPISQPLSTASQALWASRSKQMQLNSLSLPILQAQGQISLVDKNTKIFLRHAQAPVDSTYEEDRFLASLWDGGGAALIKDPLSSSVSPCSQRHKR